MKLLLNSPSYNPLDVPEIRALISSFLTRSDCISCMCVSKDWFQDFVRPVWHTIDFAKNTSSFATVHPNTLDMYGGFISRVVNISTTGHLQALQHTHVDRIRVLETQLVHSCMNHLLLSDTIRRNQETLRVVDVHSKQPNPDTFAEQRRHGQHYLFSMDAILSLSPRLAFGPLSANRTDGVAGDGGLAVLKLAFVCITRESFSALLRHCYALQELTLHRVLLLDHRPTLALFAGSKLPHLVASLAQIWDLDPNDLDAPCLLEHFPLLEKWHVPSLSAPANVTAADMRQDISWCCPVLKEIQFDQGDATSAADILANALVGLESCSLSAWILSSSSVLGLIAHQDTLTSVTITSGSTPTATPTTTEVAKTCSATRKLVAMEWLYMIPRLCRHLRLLSMEPLLCEMDSVEKFRWRCRDLEQLRVQFKDLNKPQDVDLCLQQVCDWRRFGIAGSAMTKLKDENELSTRVVQHLLQFQQLSVVWLGTKDYCLPPLTG
ncbi:hypothetical protein BGW39_005460 [Mortierella sp. 14UC]|nr:hypothetical protein BGW39_005460 [Mortierella sp. 14UC]